MVTVKKEERATALFIRHFGKPIDSFETFKRATRTKRATTTFQYSSSLPRYFIYLNMDPDQVIEQRKKDIKSDDPTESENLERETQAYINTLLDEGLAGYSVSGILGRIQGFYSNNGRRLALDMRGLKIPKRRKKKKYSPSNSEVKTLLEHCDSARDRLIVTLMYHTGLDPVDIEYLKIGDVPVGEWEYFEGSRRKTGQTYHAVVTPDLSEALKAYLKIRGNVHHKDPLIVGREGPLNNVSISQLVGDLMRSAGLYCHEGIKPTSLRDAFEDALVDAKVHGKIKEGFMGHVSKIEHNYGGDNKKLQNFVEAMQKTYPYICLNQHAHSSSDDDGFTKEERAKIRKMLLGIEKGDYELVAKKK